MLNNAGPSVTLGFIICSTGLRADWLQLYLPLLVCGNSRLLLKIKTVKTTGYRS